jgi:hypothetical protein
VHLRREGCSKGSALLQAPATGISKKVGLSLPRIGDSTMAARTSALARADEGPVVLQVPLSKDHLRKMDVSDNGRSYKVFRIMPAVCDWPAEQVPDGPNPRSHEEECLRSAVAKAIKKTLLDAPSDFQLANRGGCLLAESLKYDPEREEITIVLSDLDVHGMADGATSNKVIAEAQNEALTTKDTEKRSEILTALRQARFNVEVVVGLTDHDRIMSLVRGRNTSIQVRPWSLSDFDHRFDWIKEIIDRNGGPFEEKVGWEENAGAEITVLDIISIMTLFHPVFDDPTERRRRSPTMAFSSKGANDTRISDKKLEGGFKQLTNVLEDILDLHDYIYVNFYPKYEQFCREYKGQQVARLATKKKKGIEKKDTVLPLTRVVSKYRVDKGIIFPLLASLRCLLDFDNGAAQWKTDPKEFFDEFGSDLMALLFEQYDLCNYDPAKLGKSRSVYSVLHNEVRQKLTESLHGIEADF